ncbi:MAG: cupin domain-containing protein [Proteobacteria bacterium]|nr:cupin domain-containing protein [Pseudomonadota bacterium]MBU1715342.1 cupin domain-containing protein [Pseudomonadota bacterium]
MTAKIKYYPKSELELKPAGVGSKMWGVALEQTLLTYFEVESNSKFETHSHESEQITMVLAGELFFETEQGTVCLGPGEVLAIPSNAVHAAFTKDKPAKAIDAWSPVMEKYKG